MAFHNYMTRKRFKTQAMCGEVNIPYGTLVVCCDGIISTKDGKPLCLNTSQNAYDYFSHNDDGQAALRGSLVQSILDATSIVTECTDEQEQYRRKELWAAIWEDDICNTLRRPEHEDFWVWSFDFYNADIDTLRYVNKLVGGKSDV